MSMVCGLDLHRGQITFDTVEVDSGEMWKGRLWKPDRPRFRRWLHDEVAPRAVDGHVAIAVEGCTGWRYVVEEIQAAGFEAHVAEPADTQAMRGRKKHAKTDRTDARLLRDLLHAGRAARVVDPTRTGAGVARTHPPLQEPRRPARRVGATHPRRAVPARRRAPRGTHPLGEHPPAALGPRRDAVGARPVSGSGSATA